jgi:invasion protein IalB
MISPESRASMAQEAGSMPSKAWTWGMLLVALLPTGAAGAEPTEWSVRHGDWTARCDRCAVYEEPICTLSARSGDSRLWLFPVGGETEPHPEVAMEYLPSRSLAFETEGRLTVAVDGVTIDRIDHPDVLFLAMSDDLYIEAPVLARLLPALRGGSILELTFADADGAGTDSYPLAGFADALDAMMAQLPIPRSTLEFMESATCMN